MRPEVVELFDKLADLSPEARVRYLSEHPVDAETLREVEQLLAHDASEADPLTQPIAFTAAQAVLSMDATGVRCGAFRLVSLIGRGGMGVVYLAERVDGEVTQRAAVKLLHPGWSDIHRERFLQEREILAALIHPNIAHLLDAGHLDDGQPYFAMEYVEGKPIDKHCEGFTLRQKIKLFLRVCGAVEYLHRNLVIHRDLKPGNILVTASGEPKLLDFGIAKLLDFDGDHTATHLRMLTPNYASPEQLNGGVVGTSSDIYSLGAVLHTLLTGKPPQGVAPGQLNPELKGDLELVLQTALRQEPQERYSSVEEFAGDLKAFLGSYPIRARRGDRIYQARKLARRYWVPAALTAAIATALLSAGGLVWYSSRPVSTLKDLKPQRITANTPELPIQAAALSPDGKSIAYADPLGIHLHDMASGATRLLPGTIGYVLVQWLPGGSLLTNVEDAGGPKAMVVSPSGGSPEPALESDSWVASPDRRLRAMAPAGHQQLLIQEAAGSNTRELWTAGGKSTLLWFQWSPNNKEIAVVSTRERISTVEAVDVAGGKRTVLIPEDRKLEIASIVWPAQDRIIVTVRERMSVNAYNCNLWEIRLNVHGAVVSSGLRKLTDWTDFPIQSGSLTTDGKRLVFVRSFIQRDVYIAEIDAGRSRLGTPRRLTLELGDDYPTAWTPDSKSVILNSDRNGPIHIFRQDLNKPTADLLVAEPGTQILSRVTPDGKSLLYCSVVAVQHTCRLMRVPLAGGTPELLAVVGNIGDVRCSNAGPCAIAQMQGENSGDIVFEVDLVKGKGREIYRDADRHIGSPDISPDGKWLASPSGTKVVLRSFSTGEIVREIPVRGATHLHSLYYAPDGKGFFAGDSSATEVRQLYIDLTGNRTVLWRQAGNFVMWAVPSPDGRHLAMVMHTIESNVYSVDNF
jgi:serine/threonine protein kinase/Tol biopolymer transport system component